MAQYICPSCGSTYFLTSKAGPRTILQVVHERTVQCVQSASGALCEDVDIHTLYCGACSWQGSLDEVVESHTD